MNTLTPAWIAGQLPVGGVTGGGEPAPCTTTFWGTMTCWLPLLMVSFTGPIARGLSLVSIVVGGVTFAFGEGGSKRLLAGIVFGVGMAIGAVNFMAWLFP